MERRGKQREKEGLREAVGRGYRFLIPLNPFFHKAQLNLISPL